MNSYTDDGDIVLSAGTKLEPAPEGDHPGICVGVINLGEEEETWEGRVSKTKKLALVWQVFPEDGQRDSSGAPFLIDVKVTQSVNDGARLRLLLESWLGRSLSSEELKRVSLAAFKGMSARLPIVHTVKNGFIHANIKDDVRDNDPIQRKFSAVSPYNGPPLTAELNHYDPQAFIQKYERMKEGKANKASTSQPASSGSNTDAGNKSTWVPF